MVYELRMYKIQPGATKKVVDASGTIARRIRGEGNTYGKLEGHWYSEFGLLHRYVHMWSYPNAEEMRNMRTKLAAKKEWQTEFVPLVAPYIISQKIRLLRLLSGKTAQPKTENNIYELRFTRLKVGKWKKWVNYLLSTEESISENTNIMRIGIWISEFSNPNEIVQIFSYKDFNSILENIELGKNKEMKDFQRESISEERNILLKPSIYSPRK